MNRMKRLFSQYWYAPVALAVTLGMWMGCTPQKGGPLGALPKASFTVSGGGDSNSVVAVNTATGSIPYFTATGQGTVAGDTAHFRFTFAGTYTVTEMVAGQGGIDSVSQQVTINQNDPEACQTGAQGFISGCTTKTWKLNPAAGAEGVGPAAGNISYFGNAANEVTGDRICDFNDTYTFVFGPVLKFTFDNMGDFLSESYLGKANGACDVNADLTPTEAPWADSNHTYSVSNTGGVMGLGQLTVIGLGAHIGLARVTNGADIETAPVNSITYDVFSMTHDPGGFDLLVLVINDGSASSPLWWTWTLRSY
jgi:hypothetical protein